MKSGRKVWLLAGSRTPIGSYGRGLRSVPVEKLAEHVYKAALRRANVSAGQLDGIYLGNKYQGCTNFVNPARLSALNAGFPAHVPAMTVQRECGSGMEAVFQAMKDIALGYGDLYLVGGAESMSTAPFLLPGSLRYSSRALKMLPKFAPLPAFFNVADDGLAPRKLVWDPKSVYMSYTAQRLADTYGITRREMDEYSLRSQMLAAEAISSGRFAVEIDPIAVPGRGFFDADEHPRKTDMAKLSSLPSAFNQKPKKGPAGLMEKAVRSYLGIQSQPPGLRAKDITAGNSSGINDGACALIVASEEKARQLGATPLAELVDCAVAGLEAEQMGLGPVLAIQKLLVDNGLTLADIDLFEINEAFAAQYLACEKLLGLDRNKVNVNGGAIALGHPIGMTGARLVLTLAHELKRQGKKRGIAALCIGGGMGIAMLIENPE